jgi:hypothetical protein
MAAALVTTRRFLSPWTVEGIGRPTMNNRNEQPDEGDLLRDESLR